MYDDLYNPDNGSSEVHRHCMPGGGTAAVALDWLAEENGSLTNNVV